MRCCHSGQLKPFQPWLMLEPIVHLPQALQAPVITGGLGSIAKYLTQQPYAFIKQEMLCIFEYIKNTN